MQENREATIVRFLSRLRPEIVEVVELQYYVEIDDMGNKAMKIERRLNKRVQVQSIPGHQATDLRPSCPRREDGVSALITTHKIKC